MVYDQTIFNGCDAQVYMDDTGGDLQEITGFGAEASVDFDNTIGEFKGFRQAWKYRIQCGKDATLNLKIVGSTSNGSAHEMLRDWQTGGNEPRTVRVDYPSSAVGGSRIDGEYIIEKLSVPLKSDDANPVMISATLKPADAIDWSKITS